MSKHFARPKGSSGSPDKSVSDQETSTPVVENRPDLLPAQQGAQPDIFDALEACFGEGVRDVELSSDDRALDELGAEGATEDGSITLKQSLDLQSPTTDELDTIGHEMAHALGSTTGEVDVDEEGDSAEAAASEAGARFASWVEGGMQGEAPKLKPAMGGRGKIQRKASYGAVPGKPMLKMGAMGWRVSALQEALNAHGSSLIVDGQFGGRTKRAVEAFQRAHGLQVDGVAGPQTAGKLNALRSVGDGGEEDKKPDAGGGDYEAFSGRPVLKRGASGAQVRSLQKALNDAGFQVEITGSFDWATVGAVKNYQVSRGLDVDGLVGPKTAHALNTRAPERKPGADPIADKGKMNYDPGNRLGKSEMNPQLVAITRKTCEALQEQGYYPYVVSGFRSFSEQNGLYEKGRSKPGPKVTWVRGGGSWHNYGLAVDIAFWKNSGSGPSWEEHHPWQQIGEQGLKAGFTRWGGDFGDRPHLEYHPKWGNKASSLASTYHSEGLAAVWKKVGAS